MKKRRNMFAGLAFTWLFVMVISFRALAGNEEKLNVILSMDGEGNVTGLETAVAMVDDGKIGVLTTTDVLNNNPEQFVFV